MEVEVPDALACVITRDIMDDPVVAADGHSYERSAITQWLSLHSGHASNGQQRSPMTNVPLANAGLIPNIALRKAIAEWRGAVRSRPTHHLDPAAHTAPAAVVAAMREEIDTLRAQLAEANARRSTTANADAQFLAGAACLYGRGTPIDRPRAVELWKQAAEQGQTDAQYCIAHIISRGIGMASVTWFRKAVEYRVEVLSKKTNTHRT